MTDFRLTRPALKVAALLMAGGLVAGCGSSNPNAVNYKSDSRAKQSTLAVPPNLLDETTDQRSLPPEGGVATLSQLQQVQKTAPTLPTVIPPVPGMHIQRDGTERWLVIDNHSPDQVWPQVRRFWQEQGFLLVVDSRDKGVMETDWNETHQNLSDGLIRDTLSKATGNAYVTAERNKYRTRLETAPNGGTYVFISQKGMREALTGTNNDSTQWQAKANDPALEGEYLKRLMAVLALSDSRQAAATPVGAPAGNTNGGAGTTEASLIANGKSLPAAPNAADAARAQQNATLAAQSQITEDTVAQASNDEITLSDGYDRAWTRVGLALDRTNFTVDDRDRNRGIYFVRYADPKDLTAAEQGFWNQVFHGKKEKVAKKYEINVRAISESRTRVSIIDGAGDLDSTPQARQIMALLDDQLH